MSKETNGSIMTDRINALVLGVGGNVSIGILNVLRNSDINLYIFGACVQKYAAGFAFCDESLLCPFATHESFLPWLKEVVTEHSIDIVLSGVEEINRTLAGAGKLNDKCKFLVPEKHSIDTFNDKLKTSKWLAENNIIHPTTLDLSESYSFDQVKSIIGLPFVVKPKVGKSSAGVFIITNKSQYSTIDGRELCVAQQFIGDAASEYTCGVYKSKFGYTEIIIMHRLLRYGSTSIAEVVQNEQIFNYCKQIADACTTTGPFNIQLRFCKSSEKPFCFEVNMRLSGTTAIRHGFGFKDCQVWIKETIYGKNYRNDFKVKPAIAVRYEAEVYFDKSTGDSPILSKLATMTGN
jgi:carbamoyl-phosphate synthase large subunit